MNNSRQEYLECYRKIEEICRRQGYRELMIAKILPTLLKSVSDRKEELGLKFDDIFSSEYLELLYGKKINKEELFKHIEDLEEQLNVHKNLFIAEFKNWLDFMDYESIRNIFSLVNKFNTLDEEFYDSFIEGLINSPRDGVKHGEFFTNRDFGKIERNILNCQNGMKVYDCTCGMGISINMCAKDENVDIYAQDINQSMAAYTKALSIIAGNKAVVKCNDTLKYPLSEKLDFKFDRIVCEQPFKVSINNEGLNGNNFIYDEPLKGDTLYIRHVLKVLKNDGIAVVLVPMGMLFKSGKQGEIRGKIVKDNYVDTVIELPNGMMAPYTNVNIAFVVLRKNKKDDKVLFIDASREAFSRFIVRETRTATRFTTEGIDKITEIFNNRKEIENISKNISLVDIEENDCNLCTLQYVIDTPETLIKIKDNKELINNIEKLKDEYYEIEEALNKARRKLL